MLGGRKVVSRAARAGLLMGRLALVTLCTLPQNRSEDSLFSLDPHSAGFDPMVPKVVYDGRFAFARIRFVSPPAGYYYRGLPAWAHGYPRAEQNLMRIVDAMTALHPHVDEGGVFSLDDPDLATYPIAYMTEAGFWTLTDHEAMAFRTYLKKGGFVIFDDFRDDAFRGGGGWANFEANMKRVLPGARLVDLDPSHPIFHAFFDIDSFDIIPQDYDTGRPVLRGVFEDNDPRKRLMAVVNFNTDVSNYWEFSATGYRPVDESNEAYKLGVNYLIYGLTH
jgi:uncharacterized protein DUF4159